MNIPELIAAIAAICALTISVCGFLQKNTIASANNRLSEVIAPMFEILEPHMLKDTVELSVSELEKLEQIFNTNKAIAGGELRELFVDKVYGKIDVTKLCRLVDREYDNLCVAQNIPIRQKSYRSKCYAPQFINVFKTRTETIEYIFRYAIAAIGIIALVIAFLSADQNVTTVGLFIYGSSSLVLLYAIINANRL